MKEQVENGVVMGWWGESFNAEGKKIPVFIPRREEEVAAEEKTNALVCSVINRFAKGGHPQATPATLPGFKAAYVHKLLTKALKSGLLSPQGEEAARAARLAFAQRL